MSKRLESYDPRYQMIIQRAIDEKTPINLEFASFAQAMSIRMDFYAVKRLWKQKLEAEGREIEATILSTVTFYVKNKKADAEELPIHRTLTIALGGTGRRDETISSVLDSALTGGFPAAPPQRRETDKAPAVATGVTDAGDSAPDDSSALISSLYGRRP